MKKRTFSGSLLSVGLLMLTVSLVSASIYLFIKSRSGSVIRTKREEINGKEELTVQNERSSWETYVDEEFGYTVSYPQILEPRTIPIQSDVYLSFIVFLAPQGVSDSGFALSVRENSLDEEVELIKEEIGKDVKAKLVKEEQVEKGRYFGRRLEYEPQDPGGGEPKVIIIINKEKFSYTISSPPEQIDKIFSTFEFMP